MALYKCGAGAKAPELKEVLSIGNIVGTGNYMFFANPATKTLVTCSVSSTTQTNAIDNASEYFTVNPYGVASFKKNCHGVIMYQATAGGTVTEIEQDFTAGSSQIIISAQASNESGVLYIYE